MITKLSGWDAKKKMLQRVRFNGEQSVSVAMNNLEICQFSFALRKFLCHFFQINFPLVYACKPAQNQPSCRNVWCHVKFDEWIHVRELVTAPDVRLDFFNSLRGFVWENKSGINWDSISNHRQQYATIGTKTMCHNTRHILTISKPDDELNEIIGWSELLDSISRYFSGGSYILISWNCQSRLDKILKQFWHLNYKNVP